MAKSVFDQPQFKTEEAAFAYVEAHLWPTGPVCPHCGSVERIVRLKGKTTRLGLHKCNACKGQFTVRQGSIFESSHLPLHLWLQVIHLMCASKKGISTRQIQRMLQCSMKTAWFLGHRIRLAMDEGSLPPFGSGGTPVEVDEAYIGINPDKTRAKYGPAHKNAILSIVDRATGRVSSTMMENAPHELSKIVVAKISREARLMTDGSPLYQRVAWTYREHGAVNHGRREYVNAADPTIHTNTVEGVFSVFKRGMRGVYQHCSRKHLPRYLAEFDFRYSNRIAVCVDDTRRAETALRGVVGKRLTYETVSARRSTREDRVVW